MTRRSACAVLLLALVACRERAPEAPPRKAATPFDRADTLYQSAKYEEAAAEYARLRDDFAGRGDQSNEWRARLWWTKSMHVLGRNSELAPELDVLMELSRGDAVREAWSRCTRGMVLTRLGNFAVALEDGETGLQVARTAGDQSLAATCYDTIVTNLSNSGRYRESLSASEQRVAIDRRRNAPPMELADALNDIGVDYRRVGRFDDAIRAYEESLALYRRMGNPEGQAKVLYNLGNIYAANGDINRTLQLKLDSLRLAEQMGHAWGLAMLHGDLAGIYRVKGNLKKARPHLDAALSISRRASLPLTEANALENLGRVETTEKNFDRARDALLQAIGIADGKKLGSERSTARSAAARNEAAAGQHDEAIRWADEALRIARELNDPEVEFEALEARAVALERAGSASAINAYLDAISLLESWRGRLALGDLRMGVAQRRLGVYEGAIRILLKTGDEEQAFDVSERARARLLLALVSEQEERRPVLTERDRLRQHLRERYEAWRSVKPALRPAIDRDITRLTVALAATEAEMRRVDAARSRVRNPQPAASSNVREKLLKSGDALLAYFWGEEHVYGWWLDRDEVRAARLGPSDRLAARIEFLREAVTGTTASLDWRSPARATYNEVVAPIGKSSRRVFVVADGPLAYVPLEVLLQPGDDRPWGAEAEFIYGPSASVLLALARPAPKQPYARAVLAVGDPVARRFYSLARLWPARRDEVAPLPFAAAEVREIRQTFGAGADVLVGADATLHRWLEAAPDRYRYLHFATHARIDETRPARSSLQLAGRDLEMNDIRGMSLRSELVVLSACETALGPQVRGEGVIGLPHAFLAAGARGVVVTLWRVGDRTAADFMADFYRELHRGTPPAPALRSVRRSWISDPRRSPHQWAPFILVGGNASAYTQ